MSKYSYEFKKKIVLEYLAGEGGPVTLARTTISVQDAEECSCLWFILRIYVIKK